MNDGDSCELLLPPHGLDWMFVYAMHGFLRACKRSLLRTHVVICVLSPPSLLQLVSNPPPLLPPSESCKRAGRQNAKQEHITHSFTFLCASLPPAHSQSACPTATPAHPRGREHTEVQLPPPFRRVLVTHFKSFSTRSVLMTHNPIHERWLHCWSLRTHHTTHILSHQSVESVSHHTETCCEQTHRSSRCRRYRHLCEILFVTTILITHTSAAEHLGRRSCLGARCSAKLLAGHTTIPSTLNRVLGLRWTSWVSPNSSSRRNVRPHLLHQLRNEVVFSFKLHVTHPITCECGKSKCTRYARAESAQPFFRCLHVHASRT